MADRSNSIKDHLNKDPKEGQELADINVTQGMVKSTLDQQSANIQIAREASENTESNNVELRSALELAADTQQGGQVSQLPPQAAQLRPETQEILQKYGVNPNISESKTSTSSTSRSGTTKTSTEPGGRVTNTTTINNVTNNNVRTETNIETPTQVSAQPQVVQNPTVQDNTPKFRAWLTGIFAKRDNENKIRDREFRKRDYELSRTTEKLMRRMEGVSRKFAEKANPDNIGRTFLNQLKLFATLFVATMLPKVWEPLMKGVSTISDNVMDLIGKGKGESFIGRFKKEFLGIEPGGKAPSFSEMMSKFSGRITESFSGVIDRFRGVASDIGEIIKESLSEIFQDRAEALKSVARSYDFSLGDIFDLKKMGSMVKDLLVAGFGGTDALAGIATGIESDKADAGMSDKAKSVFGAKGKSIVNDGSINFEELSKGFKKDENGIVTRVLNPEDKFLNSVVSEDNTNAQSLLKILQEYVKRNETNEIKLSEDTLKRIGFSKEDLDHLSDYLGIKKSKESKVEPNTGHVSYENFYTFPKGINSFKDAIQSNLGVGLDEFSLENIDKLDKIRRGVVDNKAYEVTRGLHGKAEEVDKNTSWFNPLNWGAKVAAKVTKSVTGFGEISTVSESTERALDLKEKKRKRESIREKYRNKQLEEGSSLNRASKSGGLAKYIWNGENNGNYKSTPITNKESLRNAEYIYNWLIKNGGFTPTQAAGITGVIMSESACNPKAVNEGEVKKYGFHVAGKGICQWSNNRNDDFIDWYKSRNNTNENVYPNEASLDDQLEFMTHEMSKRGKFMDLMRDVKDGDVTSAADIMLRGYENGGENGLASVNQIDEIYSKHNNPYERQISDRSTNAEYIYNKFGKYDADIDKVDHAGIHIDSIPGVESINPDGTIHNSDILTNQIGNDSISQVDQVTYRSKGVDKFPQVDKEKSSAIRDVDKKSTSQEVSETVNNQSSPIVYSPHSTNNGGNTTNVINNYNSRPSKTNDALYGR